MFYSVTVVSFELLSCPKSPYDSSEKRRNRKICYTHIEYIEICSIPIVRISVRKPKVEKYFLNKKCAKICGCSLQSLSYVSLVLNTSKNGLLPTWVMKEPDVSNFYSFPHLVAEFTKIFKIGEDFLPKTGWNHHTDTNDYNAVR